MRARWMRGVARGRLRRAAIVLLLLCNVIVAGSVQGAQASQRPAAAVSSASTFAAASAARAGVASGVEPSRPAPRQRAVPQGFVPAPLRAADPSAPHLLPPLASWAYGSLRRPEPVASHVDPAQLSGISLAEYNWQQHGGPAPLIYPLGPTSAWEAGAGTSAVGAAHAAGTVTPVVISKVNIQTVGTTQATIQVYGSGFGATAPPLTLNCKNLGQSSGTDPQVFSIRDVTAGWGDGCVTVNIPHWDDQYVVFQFTPSNFYGQTDCCHQYWFHQGIDTVNVSIFNTSGGGATAATVAGTASTSPAVQIPDGNLNCACSSTGAGVKGPINTRSGNLYTTATDLVVSSPGPALSWTRAYNSQTTGYADYTNALGYGWQDPYAVHLVTSSMAGGLEGQVFIATAVGNRDHFVDEGSGQFVPFPGVAATLVGNADGTYTETMPGGSTVTFNAQGQATAMNDGHGGQLTLTYSGANLTRVADAANPTTRYLQVDYAADGVHIADVQDPAGRTVQYTINAGGDLTQVTDVMGRHVTYTYNAHLLTGVTNNLGQAEEQTTYDSYAPTGRVIAQTEQDGTQVSVAYQAACATLPSGVTEDCTTVTTTGTDGRTDVSVYKYDAYRNVLLEVDSNGSTVQQRSLDDNLVASPTDGDGHTTQVTSNSMGLPLSVTNALTQTSTVQYDGQNRPITATDTLGRQTALSYDANNNLVGMTTGITSTSPLSLTTTYVYNVRYPGKNWLEDQTDPDGVKTHYDYNTAGQVADVTVGYGTPQAQATGYGYDALGRVITTTVGLNTPLARQDVTRYNADNTIAATIQNDKTGTYSPAHPDQDLVTRYGYDGLGRPSWRMDTLGRVAATHYNAAGQVDWTLRNLQPVTLDGSGNPIVPASPPAYGPA